MIQIFGGSGFAGSYFIDQFSSEELIINSRDDYSVSNKVDEIVYFISTVSNYNVKDNPFVDIDTNLSTLMRVLSQCKDLNLTFNFISSWFVYGDTEMPAKEESICNPSGFYSITKRCAEQLLISYCKTFNIKYRIFRLANIVGYGDKKASPQKNALQYMINELKSGREIYLYEAGNIYRDYIHVKDAVVAIKLVMQANKVNEIINISNGNPVLLKEIIDIAYSHIEKPGKVNSIKTPEFHKNVQVQSMWIDNSKLVRYGYKQQYSIEDMIKDMIR